MVVLFSGLLARIANISLKRVQTGGIPQEVFVNRIPGTVETNGTKLDRAQVFSLPEIKYGRADEENGAAVGDDNHGSFRGAGAEATLSHKVTDDGEGVHQNLLGMAPSNLSATPSSELFHWGRFISSSCCSICINEFIPGEWLRILLRCDMVNVLLPRWLH